MVLYSKIYYGVLMTLKDYAKKLGIQYRTAWNHFKQGKIEGAFKTPTGIIVIPDNILEVYKELHKSNDE